MSCLRCHGFLIRETGIDLSGMPSERTAALRCVNCGYIDDPLFRTNRLNACMHDPPRNAPEDLKTRCRL